MDENKKKQPQDQGEDQDRSEQDEPVYHDISEKGELGKEEPVTEEEEK